MTNDNAFIVKSFASLQDCLSYVRQSFVEGEFLFRGERTDSFCTTISTLDRVLSDDTLLPEVREDIKKCVKNIHVELQEFLHLSPCLAMGFLQHYELPTKVFDFTSSILVAAYFASQGKVGSAGLFAVLPRDLDSDLAEIQDLRVDSKAVRALRQSAFAVCTKKHKDLKSNDARASLDIRWYRFILTQHDKRLYSDREDLLDVRTDTVAGVLQLLIDDYAKKMNGINDWAAKWLADHVVAAPFLTRICERDETGRPTVIELISIGEGECDYSELLERVNNYRIWSKVYPDKRGWGGFENLIRMTR